MRFFLPVFSIFAHCSSAEQLADSLTQLAIAQKKLADNLNHVGFSEMRGRRPTMEDAHTMVIMDNYAWYGLYDGHGGRKVADFAAENLHKNVISALQGINDVRAALRKGFEELNAQLDSVTFDVRRQGSTAVVALVRDGTLAVANLGDSRAVVSHAGKAIALTEDHKPDRADEKARIEKLGGKVIEYGVPRVQGVLAVSRALGDKALHPYVSFEPEIRQKKLDHDDEFLIIACDGVWDVVTNQEAVDIVKQVLSDCTIDLNKAADALRDEAFNRGSGDNISVIIVRLAPC